MFTDRHQIPLHQINETFYRCFCVQSALPKQNVCLYVFYGVAVFVAIVVVVVVVVVVVFVLLTFVVAVVVAVALVVIGAAAGVVVVVAVVNDSIAFSI